MSTTTQPINIPTIKSSDNTQNYDKYTYKNEINPEKPNNTPDEGNMWDIKLKNRIHSYNISKLNNLIII